MKLHNERTYCTIWLTWSKKKIQLWNRLKIVHDLISFHKVVIILHSYINSWLESFFFSQHHSIVKLESQLRYIVEYSVRLTVAWHNTYNGSVTFWQIYDPLSLIFTWDTAKTKCIPLWYLNANICIWKTHIDKESESVFFFSITNPNMRHL